MRVAPLHRHGFFCKMIERARQVFRLLVPVLLLGHYGYVIYALCYAIAYREGWQHFHSRHAYVGGVTVEVLLATVTLGLWAQLRFFLDAGTLGPGQKLGSDELARQPYFLCDAQGYALFCSQCQAYKPLRVHHLTDTGACVVGLDHFCMFLNTLIGLRNYAVFLKLLGWLVVHWMFVFVYAAVFIHKVFVHDGRINLHLVALLVSGFWWSMFAGSLLVTSVLVYLKPGRTTMEDLSMKAARRGLADRRFYISLPAAANPTLPMTNFLANTLATRDAEKGVAALLPLLLQTFDTVGRGQPRYVVEIDPLRVSLFNQGLLWHHWCTLMYPFLEPRELRRSDLWWTVVYAAVPFWDSGFVRSGLNLHHVKPLTLHQYLFMQGVKISPDALQWLHLVVGAGESEMCKLSAFKAE